MTDSLDSFFDLIPVVDDMYPADKYDILLTDVNFTDIHEEISKKLNIEYLSNSHSAELKEVKGIIFDLNYRIFLSLPVKIKKEIKNIHFLLDTGSPRTYICEEAISSFKATIINRTYKTVLVNNRPIIALPPPPGSHFTDVNLLGIDYLQTFHAKVTMDFENEQFSFFFEKLSLGEQSIVEQGGYHKSHILGIVGGIIIVFGFLMFRRRPYLFFFLVMSIHFINQLFDIFV